MMQDGIVAGIADVSRSVLWSCCELENMVALDGVDG